MLLAAFGLRQYEPKPPFGKVDTDSVVIILSFKAYQKLRTAWNKVFQPFEIPFFAVNRKIPNTLGLTEDNSFQWSAHTLSASFGFLASESGKDDQFQDQTSFTDRRY